MNWYQPSLHSPQLYRDRDAPRQRAAATRRRETDEARPYIRVHRCSSTSTCPRKRYATRRAVRRYIHTYIPYHLQQRNNELMKFIPAKRVNSTVMLYVYTSTPPQQYQYVPKEMVRHHASCEEVYTYVYPVSLAATK